MMPRSSDRVVVLRRRRFVVWVLGLSVLVSTTNVFSLALTKEARASRGVVAQDEDTRDSTSEEESEIAFDAIVDEAGTTARFTHAANGDLETEVASFCATYVNASLAAHCATALREQVSLVRRERSLPSVTLEVQVDQAGNTATFRHNAGNDLRAEAALFCAPFVPEESLEACAAKIAQTAVEKVKLDAAGIWGKLLGLQLIAPGGQFARVDTDEALDGKKHVALLFAADWCGPCRQFTPKLAQFYDRLITQRRRKDALEIIWVSGSRDPNGYAKYHNEMPWPALPLDPALRQSLMQAFSVQGFPTLLLFDQRGRLITADGVQKISNDPYALAFPYRSPAQQLGRFARAIVGVARFSINSCLRPLARLLFAPLFRRRDAGRGPALPA